MTIPPKRRAEIDIREEVDIVRIDPLFVRGNEINTPVAVWRSLCC